MVGEAERDDALFLEAMADPGIALGCGHVPNAERRHVVDRERPDALAVDLLPEHGDALVDPERLRVRGWVQPGTALCLAVDRSGSMGGKPLATSAVAAAAVANRAPADYSVLAFGKDVVAHYLRAADVELEAFEAAVTDWERRRGFERF